MFIRFSVEPLISLCLLARSSKVSTAYFTARGNTPRRRNCGRPTTNPTLKRFSGSLASTYTPSVIKICFYFGRPRRPSIPCYTLSIFYFYPAPKLGRKASRSESGLGPGFGQPRHIRYDDDDVTPRESAGNLSQIPRNSIAPGYTYRGPVLHFLRRLL